MAKKKNSRLLKSPKSGSSSTMRTGRSKSVVIVVMIMLFLAIVAVSIKKLLPTTPDSTGGPPKTIYSPPDFKSQGEFTFLNSDGSVKLKLDMEVADNPDERQTGMMKRDKMTEEQGMLFVFNNEQIRSFWMQNTILSLDIIFINANQEIVFIQKNAIPFDQSHYWSEKPARFVLEVIAGYCDKYNIAPGDKVKWIRYDQFGG